jgi:AAA family ATP:ADP antiporter
MILLAAVSVIPAALLSNFTYMKLGEPEIPVADPENGSHMGWQKFKENRTLVYLLAVVLMSQLVAAVLDLKFQGLLSIEFADAQDKETAFQGWFWGTLNTSVLVLQFIVAPLLLSFVSLRVIHVLMPLIHACAIGFALYEPSIFSVGLAFFLFKAFDYSVFRAAKEVLYVPLGYDERYRAKQVIDVFGYRTGKGGSSVVIVMLQKLGVVMSNYYLAIGFVATAVWLALVFQLTKHAEKDN